MEADKNKTVEFFMAMVPPTCTHQEKKVCMVRNKPPVFYDPPELKAAKQKLEAHLAQHMIRRPYSCGVRLITKWIFPADGKHPNGSYRITKPDTDNLQKALKDIMTKLGFWQDDCLVASEITEKFWGDVPGIYIKIEKIQEE